MRAGFGSTWSIDSATGTVVRWDGTTYQVDKVIQITDPPFYDGSCLTSIAVGAGAVWVTLLSRRSTTPASADASPQPGLSPPSGHCRTLGAMSSSVERRRKMRRTLWMIVAALA